MHPEVIKKYKQNNYEVALERAEDVNERTFWEQVKESKQPVKREIMQISRVKQGKQEYFTYQEEVTSKDSLGNEIHCYRSVGKYEDPSFRYNINQNGQRMASEILRTETVYEYKWPGDWTPELEELVTEDPSLTLITQSRHYGGFTFEQFKEDSYDDLVTFGRFGTKNPVIVNELKKEKGKSK
jgi:hypothetical protein